MLDCHFTEDLQGPSLEWLLTRVVGKVKEVSKSSFQCHIFHRIEAKKEDEREPKDSWSQFGAIIFVSSAFRAAFFSEGTGRERSDEKKFH